MKNFDKERGTVLLTTLLIMAVMATVAVAIMDDIRFAVKRTINVGDYAQVDWYVKGCLLYTSPSPRDRQKSRMPSSA